MNDTPEALYRDVSARYANMQLSEARFRSAWLQLARTKEGASAEHAAELFVVLSALEGDPLAVQDLRQRLELLMNQLDGFRLSEEERGSLVDDTLRLLVAPPSPRLARYSARGPLDGWLNVVLVRQAINLRNAQQKLVEFDEVLLGTMKVEAEPELELLKERFRGKFSAAFRSALGKLSARQRNLLRQHYLDGLTLEELGTLYRVHRATVARNLADARAELLEKTRDEVAQRIGVSRLEVDSIVKLVQSRLDVSATFFLSQPGGAR